VKGERAERARVTPPRRLPYVTELRVEVLAGLVVLAGVAALHDHGVTGVVALLREHREPIPLGREPDEELLGDGVSADPGVPLGRVRIAFRLSPFDALVERAKHRLDLAPPERLVHLPRQIDVAHVVFPRCLSIPTRAP
jgi:hypothetical protein